MPFVLWLALALLAPLPASALMVNVGGQSLVDSIYETCSEGQVVKIVSGAEACAADSTGGTPSFDAITAGTNTTAAMVLGTGGSLATTGSGSIIATTGDSATGFFSSGTLETARLPATIVYTIASGATAVNPSSINSGACNSSDTTATATGAASTDVVSWSPNADISAVTGYTPATTGGVMLYVFATTNTVNFRVCNPTTNAIDPGSITVNWRIQR